MPRKVPKPAKIPNILTTNASTEEKYALLRQRLIDEKYRKNSKRRRQDAARHKKTYQKDKHLKEIVIKSAERKELRKTLPTWRIILTSSKKILTDVTWLYSKDEAIQKFNKILIENRKDIRIPKKVLIMEHNVQEAKYELILLKKRMEGDSPETLIRNEIGQFVPNVSNYDKWIIYEKADFYFEETFWVYGFHPRHQRKDFWYILNEILLKEIENVKYPQKRVSVFKNKLIIDDDNYELQIIICKNQDECIRLYNELEKEVISIRLKSIMWSGFVKDINSKRLVERISKKTGWDFRKINRTSTRP